MLDLNGQTEVRFEPPTFLHLAQKAVHNVHTYFPLPSCLHAGKIRLARETNSMAMKYASVQAELKWTI